MKARPILMSAPMVRALLEGRKTQTRRVVKEVTPTFRLDETRLDAMREGFAWFSPDYMPDVAGCFCAPCPYGKPGDLLWVRETFSYDRMDVDRDGTLPPWYWADGNPEHWDWSKPKPSIHMPRWASRLTLELTGVRVERLHQITGEDAVAEGAPFDLSRTTRTEAIYWFKNLWESINGVESAISNPWIWVLEFQVHQANVDSLMKARAA